MTPLALEWARGASGALAAGPVSVLSSGKRTRQQWAGQRTQRGALAGDRARSSGAERLQMHLLLTRHPQQRGRA